MKRLYLGLEEGGRERVREEERENREEGREGERERGREGEREREREGGKERERERESWCVKHINFSVKMKFQTNLTL